MISTFIFVITLVLAWFAWVWSRKSTADLLMKTFLIGMFLWGFICCIHLVFKL